MCQHRKNDAPVLKFRSFWECHTGSALGFKCDCSTSCTSRPVRTDETPKRKELCDGDWNKWKIKGLKGEKWEEITEESFNIRRFPEPLRHYFNIPLLLMINLLFSFAALLKFYYFAAHTFDCHNYDYIRFFFLSFLSHTFSQPHTIPHPNEQGV